MLQESPLRCALLLQVYHARADLIHPSHLCISFHILISPFPFCTDLSSSSRRRCSTTRTETGVLWRNNFHFGCSSPAHTPSGSLTSPSSMMRISRRARSSTLIRWNSLSINLDEVRIFTSSEGSKQHTMNGTIYVHWLCSSNPHSSSKKDRQTCILKQYISLAQ